MDERFHLCWLPRLLVRSSLVAGVLGAGTLAFADNTEYFAAPAWQPADSETVFRNVDEYLRTADVPPEVQTRIRDRWWSTASTADGPTRLLDRLAACLALADDRVANLIAFCDQVDRPVKLPDFSWLAVSETPALVRHNMRLFYARWLVQNSYDDEALAWTDGLRTSDVVAPDELLFYRAVASHRLVQTDRADGVLAELLQRSDELPVRYQKVAQLMQQDLAGVEDDSLDHVARRMADVRRRLELGRAGKIVQSVENGVIESLDKLIKKLEEQAQQQAQSAAAGGQPSGTPMQESRLAELKAPGKVDPRNIGDGADWGNMPDKEREQALQDIGREFPSHYREVIEEYFRRLAAEPSDDQP